MLSCRDGEKYLVAFLDNALQVADHLDIQKHLDACMSCTNRAEAERALRAFVRQHATLPPPPESLKQHIMRHAMALPPSRNWWTHLQAPVQLRDCVVGVAAAAAVLWLTLGPSTLPSDRADRLHQLVRDASLAYSTYTTQRMPLEVVSADEGIVTQWLNRRMDAHLQYPAVMDTAMQLLGGRLGHLFDRKSAVLMYQRRDVPILLFAFKSDQLAFPVQHTVRAKDRLFYVQTVSGRPVVMWQHGGLTYSLVGDVDRQDLLQTAAAIDHR